MASINVVGSSELIVALSGIKIPETRRLSLSVTESHPRSRHATVPALNHILRKTVVRAETSVTILDDAFVVDAKAIEWQNITHLQIAAPTQVRAALAIIGKLPGIVQAVFCSILVEDIPDEARLLNGPAAEHARVAPLNTSIQHLALDHEQGAPIDQTAAAAIKYVALALPRLLVLITWAAVGLQSFIDDYTPAYHHLSNIRFRPSVAE
ncbi:hypothetical protein H4R21_004895 [Coemansia helicoidea]|uniref:Uncharacterized protein n=1 Tax=Coemansia helicoidea TaxID=1286919 RepID=A0ACC1KVB1_9FUNG|nr:hypothetical protein H4R21_004895 [Coemansia helicoidea]